jgi:hypothetical protein
MIPPGRPAPSPPLTPADGGPDGAPGGAPPGARKPLTYGSRKQPRVRLPLPGVLPGPKTPRPGVPAARRASPSAGEWPTRHAALSRRTRGQTSPPSSPMAAPSSDVSLLPLDRPLGPKAIGGPGGHRRASRGSRSGLPKGGGRRAPGQDGGAPGAAPGTRRGISRHPGSPHIHPTTQHVGSTRMHPAGESGSWAPDGRVHSGSWMRTSGNAPSTRLGE